MRALLCLILACFTAPALAEEENFRVGGQVSTNSYRLDDPNGKTANGGGASYGLIAFYDTGRNGRFMFNVAKSAYTLTASQTEVGQDVSSTGAAVSYQKMWRVSRDFKPWFGAGLGYTSSRYTNRHTLTPSGAFSVPLPNRDSTDTAFLLNASADWPLNQDFDFGVEAQFTKAISNNSSSMRVGVYFVY